MRLRRRLRLRLTGRFGTLPRPDKWVFVVGCYNSGTTLLHDLLAQHPAVGSLPTEGQFLTDQLPTPKSLGLARLWAADEDRFRLDETSAAPIDVTALKRQWGARFNRPHSPVLLEKSPTNAARTRWLQEHFANAHFIGIIRNGYAVAEGISRKADHSLSAAAQQWARCNRVMLDDFEHLQHKVVVRYEALAADPTAVLRTLLLFLGLAAEALDMQRLALTPLAIHERTTTVTDLNAESLAALDAEGLAVIEAAAGDLLGQLGYARAGTGTYDREGNTAPT